MIQASRFRQTPTVTQDGVTRFAEWRPPAYGVVPERLHMVTQTDLDRPDLISWRYYGTVDLWWAILDYNRVTDPFSLRIGDRLRIPEWNWRDVPDPGQVVTAEPEPERPPSPAPYAAPPYAVPDRVAVAVPINESTIFNLAIQLPDCDAGVAHIELQLATDGQFADVVISRLTAASIERWYFYDPWTNNGSGGHLPFPANGIDLGTYATQPVYFRITTADGIVDGTQYYPRYRVIVADSDATWQGLPPIIIQTD